MKIKKTRGGECGCKNPPSLFSGGRKRKTRKMRGGFVAPPSFSLENPPIPQTAYYTYNNLTDDPTSPEMQPSSRLMPDMESKGGGKKRKRVKRQTKRRKQTKRRQQGGFSLGYPFTTNYSYVEENPLGSKYSEYSNPIA